MGVGGGGKKKGGGKKRGGGAAQSQGAQGTANMLRGPWWLQDHSIVAVKDMSKEEPGADEADFLSTQDLERGCTVPSRPQRAAEKAEIALSLSSMAM